MAILRIRRFEETYGENSIVKLVEMFAHGATCQEVADAFGMADKSQAFKWKKLFVHEVITITYSDIVKAFYALRHEDEIVKTIENFNFKEEKRLHYTNLIHVNFSARTKADSK